MMPAMSNVVTTDPQVMHGKPCFAGTRVPVDILFDYLGKGYPVDYFVAQFPTVTRDQVLRLLDEARERTAREALPVGERA